jgi:polyhydroxybutyrate depolymerase
MPYATRWALAVIALGLAMILLSASLAEAGEQRTINVAGVSRSYYVAGVTAVNSGARPLVIMLHGAGGTGEHAVRQYGWERKAEQEGFIVAGPDAWRPFPDWPANFLTNPRFWNDGGARGNAAIQASDDVGFIDAMVDDIARLTAIDRARVYVTGFSSGAGMAQRMAVDRANRYAAVAPIAGIVVVPPTSPVRAMPFLYLSGDRDPLNPVQGGPVRSPWGNTFTKPAHGAISQRWRELNGCPPPMRSIMAPSVRLEMASPCRDGVEVRYVLVEGLGHRWAGGLRDALPESIVGPASNALNVTDTVWDFLRRWRIGSAGVPPALAPLPPR